MIKGKSRKWHHKKTIEMWEEIVNKGLTNKKDTELYYKYEPTLACFLCEWYNEGNCMDKYGVKCPFKVAFPNQEDVNCVDSESPYEDWCNSNTNKEHQIAAENMVKWLEENF